MTLSEFIEARVGDQIATAREVQAQGVTEGLSPDDPRSAALRLASSVLARCAAVRAVVELHAADGIYGETCVVCFSGDYDRLDDRRTSPTPARLSGRSPRSGMRMPSGARSGGCDERTD